MRIRVVAFASAADALGGGETAVELPAGSSLQDLRQNLEREHPDLVPIWPRLAVAVDGELARPERALTDGVEVALLPPVSGGSGRARARLSDEPLDVAAIAAEVGDPTRGAVLLFAGTVRNHHAGRPVERLTYSAYRPMAEKRLALIVQELEAASSELRIVIVHRLGVVSAGEASVVIAVASPHRQAAYEASREALERLKREVPIWKREHYADGSATWREEEPLATSPPPPAAPASAPRS